MNSQNNSTVAANSSDISTFPDTLSGAPSFQALFMRPRYSIDSPINVHLPILFWLVDALKPRNTVVLGCDDGNAHFAICQCLERLNIDGHCHGIGFWQSAAGDDAKGMVPVSVQAHHDMLYDKYSHLSLGRAIDEAVDIAGRAPKDLIFVDLKSLPDNSGIVAEALITCLADDGLLVLHGASSESQLFRDNCHFERLLTPLNHLFFDIGDGLTILGPGNQLPRWLNILRSDVTDTNPKNSLLHVFKRLGEGLAGEAKAKKLADANQTADQELKKLREKVDTHDEKFIALRDAYETRSAKLADIYSSMYDCKLENLELTATVKRLDSVLDGERTVQLGLNEKLHKLNVELEAKQARIDEMHQQLATKEISIQALETVRDNATHELKQERDSRFKETAALTSMVENLRGRNAKVELERNYLSEKIKKIEYGSIELHSRNQKIRKKERPLERWLIKNILGNERKFKKYMRDRDAYFKDSESNVMKLYFRLRPGA